MFLAKLKRQFKWYLLASCSIWLLRIVLDFDGRITPFSWVLASLFTAFILFCSVDCLARLFARPR